MSSAIILLLALASAAGVFLVFLGYTQKGPKLDDKALYAERLARYGSGAKALTTDEVRLATTTFSERMIVPQLDKLRVRLASVMSADYKRKIEIDLALANNPMGFADYVLLRGAAPVVGVLVGLGMGKLGDNFILGAFLAVVFGGAGVVLPWMFLKQAIAEQRKRYSRALPDLIDFLVVVVEAGLGFDQAVQRVVGKFSNSLTQAFGQALREIELGRPRAEAYLALAERSGVEPLQTFIQTVLTSEKMGTPMAQTLREQSDDVRWKRREKAREMGAKAALKMTVPMVMFIFPAIWVVLLGPAFFSYIAHGGGL